MLINLCNDIFKYLRQTLTASNNESKSLKFINDIRDNLYIISQEKNRITIVMRFRLEVINFCKVEGEQYLTSC